MRVTDVLRRGGIAVQVVKIVGLLVAAVAILQVATWVGSPYADSDESSGATGTPWTAPPLRGSAPAPPPADLPRIEFPPPLPTIRQGDPQPVPTRYGLTYTVPSSGGWRPSSDRTMGWTSDGELITAYGSVSDYGYDYCPELDGSDKAAVGITGRNATDAATAARSEIDRVERALTDDAGGAPRVAVSDPVQTEVSNRSAVRYTAELTDVSKGADCDAAAVRLHVVATAAYATAEVAVFVVLQRLDVPDALSDDAVAAIVGSLRSSEQ
ncbi:hypothetical protein [Nocardia jiangsuensis]|uniref:DUF8017 domain-containing protein n=1 Tax=Nocardia jiangsuensis TaxID=1691563 RepID=A0ABV8DPT4_9NOCA